MKGDRVRISPEIEINLTKHIDYVKMLDEMKAVEMIIPVNRADMVRILIKEGYEKRFGKKETTNNKRGGQKW